MCSSHPRAYGLYQTLTSTSFDDSKLSQKDLSTDQKKELLCKLSAINKAQTDAIFMLIIEHARINNEFIYDQTNMKLPYGLEQKSKIIVFDLKNLPISLRWILWRFSNVIVGTSTGTGAGADENIE